MLSVSKPAMIHPMLSVGWRRLRFEQKTALLLLVATGLLKIFAYFLNVPFTPETDPVFNLPNRQNSLLGGILELAIVILLSLHASRSAAAKSLVGLGFAFCTYHVVLELKNPGGLCPCLGAVHSWLPFVSAYSEGKASLSIALWLLLVGLWSWLCEAKEP